jgi:hypothetical protein
VGFVSIGPAGAVGRALVVLRSADAPGQIALTATAPGLETASIAVQTKKPVIR